MISTRSLAGGIIASAVLAAMAGCGPQGTPTAAPPARYQVTVVEALPSAAQPIHMTWRGTWVRKPAHWSRLTEQIGTASPMVVTPISATRTVPEGTPRSKSHSVKTAVTTSTKTTVSSTSTADTTAVKPVPSALSTLAAEVTLWATARGQWPITLLPTVDARLKSPLHMGTRGAQIRRTWHVPVVLQDATVPATETLAAVVAWPHGILHHVQWTLVVRTQVHEITPPHGVPYWLASLTWTERGDLTRE